MAAERQELMRRETGGVFDSVARLADAIRELSTKHNVLVPGGAIGGTLPVLHSAAVAFVFVDDRETYGTGGAGVGIGKSALDRIAAAGGIQAVPHLCGRSDDGGDPHVVEWQAVGTVKQLDGTDRLVSASKRIDLRADRNRPVEEWGDDAQEIKRIADKAMDRNGKPAPRDPWPQIMQQRQHIMSLAESKSWNRMLRKALGIRASYSKEDVRKGFAVVRLQFTGRHEDPAIERMVAEKIADRALGSTFALYGGDHARALPPTRRGPVPRLMAPATQDADDEPSEPPFDPSSGEVIDHEPAQKAPPAPSSGGGWSEPGSYDEPDMDEGQPAASAPGDPRKPARDPLVPHGKGKPRGPASQLSVEGLGRVADYLDGCAANNEDQRKAGYQRQDAADCREWAAYFRAGGSPF